MSPGPHSAAPREQKITPFLWFDDKAEEAVNLYTSVFRDSKVGEASRYGEEGHGMRCGRSYPTAARP